MKNEAKLNLKKPSGPFFFLIPPEVGVGLRGGSLTTKVGTVKLHPSEGTHWIAYMDQNFFDSYGAPTPENFLTFCIGRNSYCLFSKYKIPSHSYALKGLRSTQRSQRNPKTDFFRAAYCFLIVYLAKVLEIDFITTVPNFY